MSDGTFRPERKPINQPVSQAESAQETLQQMSEIRSMAANEPLSDGPAKFTGNVPPQLRKAIENQSSTTQNNRGPRRRETNISEGTYIKDNHLQELLAQLKDGDQYEKIDLPSRGKFYNGEDGPVDGAIEVRPMTGEEEQILATPRFVKKGQAINMIFDRCMKGKYNSENFLTIDRTYLLVYLRGISYTPNYDAEVKCPLCESKFSTSIDLNDLYLDECPDEFDINKLSGVLPTSGFEFQYRLSCGADDQRVQDYKDRRIKDFDLSGQADDTLHYRIALLINEIQGITDKHQIQVLLRALPISDLNYLRNLINEPPFGLDTTCEIVCPSCQQEFEIDLPLEVGFFFPKNKKAT